MADTWVHCNKCFEVPSPTYSDFWFTSCGHILCKQCAAQNDVDRDGGICSICARNAHFTAINRNMRPDILELFKQPKHLLHEYLKKLNSAINFQEYHRNHLMKYQQDKFADKIRSLEEQLNRRTEMERTLFEEKQHLRDELQRERDNNISLTSRLNGTLRSFNGFIKSPSMNSNPNTSSIDSSTGRQLHNSSSPGFSFTRKIRSRPLKPVICAPYSRPMSVRSQPPGGSFISPAMSFRPPQPIGTGPLMPGRITKGPILPRSFGIHPTPPSLI